METILKGAEQYQANPSKIEIVTRKAGSKPKYMKLKTASAEFGVGVDLLRECVHMGKLPAKQFGDKPRGKDTRPFLVRPEDVEALMSEVDI